jgi:hypothetical protein
MGGEQQLLSAAADARLFNWWHGAPLYADAAEAMNW